MSRSVISGVLCLALFGCVSWGVHKENETVITDVEKESVAARVTQRGEGYVRKVEGLYLGDSIPLLRVEALPSVFNDRVILKADYPQTLHGIAEFVEKTYSVKVRVAPDASIAAAAIDSAGVGERLGRELRPGEFFISTSSGTVKTLLDDVTSKTNTWWRFREGMVTIGYFDTKVFELKALATKTSLNRTVSNVSAGASSSGGGDAADAGGSLGTGGQSMTTDTSIELFTGITDSVKAMLSDKGKVTATPGSSSLVVTDTQDVLERVGVMMDAMNARLNRQVFIDVRLISLELRESDSYGINWNVLRESLNGRTAVTAITSGAAQLGANSIGVEVIDPAYNYAGTELVIEALAEQGNLAVQYSDTAYTLSGRPVVVRVGEQLGYLAENNRTVVPNVGVIFETKSGIVNTGISMTMLPMVMDNNEVLLQLDFSLTSLRELRKIGDPNNGGVEQPTLAPRELSSTIRIKSGATVALRGVEQESTRLDSRGIGSPKFSLLGGGSNAEKRRTVLVVLLTPRIQE